MMIDPNALSDEELRDHVRQLQAERERSTGGWHETVVDAYAACPEVLCEGNDQQPVKAVRTTHVVTFGEADGDQSGPYAGTVSHTNSYLRFLHDGTIAEGVPEDGAPNDMPCPHCGATRSVTEQLRPTHYGRAFGGSEALLRVRRAGVAEHATAESVLAAAAKTEPETPIEALQRRFVMGEIEDAEYAQKLAGLGLPVPAALRPAPKPKPKPVEPEPKAA